MRVFLAGEGRTELGELAREPPFREQPGEKGVLVALIERIGGNAFTVVDGVVWTAIRKYQAGRHASAEVRNVLGLALHAKHALCDAVVFSRDRDGSVARERELEKGVQRARELFTNLEVIGGVAIENIEGWILVLLGQQGERISSKRTKLELEKHGVTTLLQKVDAIASASLTGLPAGSLSTWLERARSAFAQKELHDGA